MRIEVFQGLDAARTEKLKKVKAEYLIVCSRSDIYVDCTVSGTTYRMNAGKDAATAMDAGVRLVEQLSQTEMDVRDFNNTSHIVTLETAQQIRNLQAADAHNHWIKKCEIVDAINAAPDIETLRQIDMTFNVNVE